jgi:hypothetical protein
MAAKDKTDIEKFKTSRHNHYIEDPNVPRQNLSSKIS